MKVAQPILMTGNIDQVVDHLLVWAKQPSHAFGLIEYSAEDLKEQVTNRLRTNLVESNIPLHTISLPLKKHPLDVARFLTDKLNSLSPGLVFVQGFDTAFHQSFSLKYAFEVLRTFREQLFIKELRQIWWLSPNAHTVLLHTRDALYSYFMLRLSFSAV